MLKYVKPSIVNVLARNLKRLMDDAEPPWSQNRLAKKSGVEQTSIGYMLHPEKRAPLKSGKLPSPTVAQVDRVAAALGKEAWQLLHPSPDEAPLSVTERKRLDAFNAAMKQLQR